MAELASFFNSVNGDRTYSAEDFASYFAKLVTNGVFPSPSTNLQVISTDSYNISVSTGAAWINGYMYSNTTTKTLAIDVADAQLKRKDLIVVQLDTTQRTIQTIVKKGTPSASPVAPTVSQTATVYELALAEITINAAAVKIAQSDIVDTRMDTSRCGWVDSLIQADTTTIFNQFQSWYTTKTTQYESDWNAFFGGAKLQNDPNKQNKATMGTSAPSAPVASDIWMDTTTSPYKIKIFDGSTWQTASPTKASDVSAEKAISKTTSAPSNPAINDLWLDTSAVPNRLKKYDGAQWLNCSASTYSDVGAQKPITIASVAPSNPVSNDLWLDTSALPYVLKRWSGVAWGSASIYAASQVPISDAGNIITATNVETALQELAAYKKRSAFEVTMSADQSVPTSPTSVKVNFDTVGYDYKSEWDATNKVFVSAAGGIYLVNVGLLVSSTAAGSIRYEIIKVAVGGAETSLGLQILQHGGQAFFLTHPSKQVRLAPGEKIYVKFRYDGGTGSATVSKDNTYTQFSGIQVADY
jgi:hypothetical protein